MEVKNTELDVKSKYNKKMLAFPIIIFLMFIFMYVLFIKITINNDDGKFIHRIFNGTEYFIAIGATTVIIRKFENIKLKYILAGIVFVLIGCSDLVYERNLNSFLQQGSIIMVTFIAGCLLSNRKNIKSSLVEKNKRYVVLSILIGIILSIPLAIINFIYFRITMGTPMWHNPLASAFYALNPGFSEEVVFRFFIINLFISILDKHIKREHALFISMFMGIIPHSLIHFPELWIVNPIGAIVMLVLTSVLFGLPMAYLQYKRDLETAAIFHWSIDFIRFLGGY